MGEKLGKTRSAMVRAMLDNPKITIKELAGILDISTTAVENNIRYLKSEGYLKRVGPAEGGHWEVLK